MSGNSEGNGVIASLERVEEVNTIYVEISTNVNRYWKSGVTSKLKLSQEIKKFFDFREETDAAGVVSDGGIGAAYNNAFTDFFNSLPFGEKVAQKFNRIARAEWLNEKGLDISILPNCYNTLEKLASKEVCGNPVVVDYLKENLTSGVSREDVTALIRKATSDEDGDDKKEDEDDGSNETRKTLLLTIKINKESFGSVAEVTQLLGSVKSIEDFIKDKSKESFGSADGSIINLDSDAFNVETKDEVFDSLSKKARKSEVDKSDWKSLLPVAA